MCLHASDPKLATAILQTAAEYKAILQDLAGALPQEEQDEYNRLEAEYFILRTALVGSTR